MSDSESMLSSELEMLRLESISGDGSGARPRPKRERRKLPWKLIGGVKSWVLDGSLLFLFDQLCVLMECDSVMTDKGLEGRAIEGQCWVESESDFF